MYPPTRYYQQVYDETLEEVGLDPKDHYIDLYCVIDFAPLSHMHPGSTRIGMVTVYGVYRKVIDPDVKYLSGPRPGVYVRVR
jgi:hypothetical protein